MRIARARGIVVTGAVAAVLVAGVGTTANAEPLLVSELTFASASPAYDPYGEGTSLIGDVSVTEHGWLDFFGRSVVETPDRANLNPGSSDFSFGARIALTRGVGDWNVMQKGAWSDQQWKLSTHQVAGGAQLSCRISGSSGAVHVFTDAPVSPDGAWHHVACVRVGDSVRVEVDGQTVAQKSGTIGSVSSTKPYLIGSKGAGNISEPDQYLGLLDDAYVAVGVAGDDDPPPPDDPPATALAFRGAVGTNTNAKAITSTVPGAVQPDDAMLLFVTANRSNVTLQAPAGWQSVERRIDDSMQSQLWVQVAEAGDAGATVRVTTTANTKMTAQLLAYSGTDPVAPIETAASAGQATKSTAHTTPVASASPTSWAVSMWSNKTSSTSTWSTPSSVAVRQFQTTSGSGRVTSLVGDSAGPVGTTSTGGLTATATQSGSIATMWTVVLRPAG